MGGGVSSEKVEMGSGAQQNLGMGPPEAGRPDWRGAGAPEQAGARQRRAGTERRLSE